jgi:CCR4-NOT transcription complex subunit 4
MFLHEPGEDSESFTRAGLSSLNAGLTQHAPSDIQPSQSPQPLPPPQHTHPIAAATQDFEHAVSSPTESAGDGPALPATASWADQARRASRTTSVSANSPLVQVSIPAVQPDSKPESSKAPTQAKETEPEESSAKPTNPPKKSKKPQYPYFDDLLKKAFNPNISFTFKYPAHYTDGDRWIVENMPPLFDPTEGTRRRIAREKEDEERRRLAEVEIKPPAAEETEEVLEEPAGGSSQLGGEPEERPSRGAFGTQHSLLPSQQAIGSSNFGQTLGLTDDLSGLGAGTRTMTPSQQQQILLQQFNKLGNPSQAHPAGHGRQNSRYFLNEAMGTASKNLNKQLGHGQFANQGLSQFNYSSVQGPPPGLKTTGTPPVGGGGIGMFSQGHGFTTPGVGYGPRENDKLWEAHGGRGAAGRPDAGKREFMFPYHQYPSTSGAPTPGVLSFPYGGQGGAYPESAGPQKQKKKGKKHRHANTSSSGGGVVDVSDPSILQMRVGGGMGQGGYGGQGQGGFSLHSYTNRW